MQKRGLTGVQQGGLGATAVSEEHRGANGVGILERRCDHIAHVALAQLLQRGALQSPEAQGQGRFCRG